MLNGAIILAALGLRIQDLFEFLVNADYRSYLLQQTPKNQYTQFAIKYWQEYFSNFRSDREKQERIESTINVLQYFEDSMVRNFTCCYHSTIDFKQAMEKGITILCYIPMGQNLKGSQVIGSLMATKFQRLAYRRTPEERKKQYYLIIDEMHHFVDLDFSISSATLRQYGLSLFLAHQSMDQPPLNTEEGQGILNTIIGNSKIKVFFQLNRPDAEYFSKIAFKIMATKVKHIHRDISLSYSTSDVMTKALSFSETCGKSFSQSEAISDSMSLGYGFTLAIGSAVNETRSYGHTQNRQNGLSTGESFSFGQSDGISKTRSQSHGLTLSFGKGFAHIYSEGTGQSMTIGEGLTVSETDGRGLSRGHQLGETKTSSRGLNFVISDGKGTTISHQEGKGSTVSQSHGTGYSETSGRSSNSGHNTQINDIPWQRANDQAQTSNSFSTNEGTNESTGRQTSNTFSEGESQQLSDGFSEMNSHTQATGSQLSESLGEIESITRSISESFTKAKAKQQQQSSSNQSSETHGESSQESESEGSSVTVSDANGQTLGTIITCGGNISFQMSEGTAQSLSAAFGIVKNISDGHNENIQKAIGKILTVLEGSSYTQNISHSLSEGLIVARGIGVNSRTEFYSGEEERELLVEELQTMENQYCYVVRKPLEAELIKVHNVEDSYYPFKGEDEPYLKKIQRFQRESMAEIASQLSSDGEKFNSFRQPGMEEKTKPAENAQEKKQKKSPKPKDFMEN